MRSTIVAKTSDTTFPSDLASARKLLDALDADIRAEGAELEKQAAQRGSSFRWPPSYAEKAARRERLQAHVQRLQAAHDAETLLAAASEPARAPRQAPQPIEAPPKPKGLRAAEKAVAEARAALDVADAALRDFARREHTDSYRAARESLPLLAKRDEAQKVLKQAMAKAEGEAAPWREACAAWIEVEYTRRRIAALTLLDQIEDQITPLLDAGRAAQLDQRRVDHARSLAQALRLFRRSIHAAR